MNANARKQLYSLGATVLGVGSAALALQSRSADTGSAWFDLGLLLAGLIGAGVCAAAAWRIDPDDSESRHALVREALRVGEVRGIGADPAWTLIALSAFALAFAGLAWTDVNAGKLLPALCSSGLAAMFAAGVVWRWRTRSQRRELRIDAAGLHSPDFGLIEWADVVGLRRYRARLAQTDCEGLQVLVRDPARYSDRLPSWLRGVYGLDAAHGKRYASLLLPLDIYGIALEPAYVAATTLRRRVAAPFVDGWQPQMRAEEIDELLAAAPAPSPMAIGFDPPPVADSQLPMLRRQLRHRAWQRRWRESAPTRLLIAASATIAYVAVRAWSDGLLG